jgi:hypothetical protein
LFWFVLLDGGIVALITLVVSRSSYDKVSDLSSGKLPPQSRLRALLVGTAAIHAGEAMMASRIARRRGVASRGWALQTFVVGFPSLLALRQASPAS